MLRKQHILFFLVALLSFSCKTGRTLEEYGKKFAEIIKNEDGMFRGAEPGKTLSEIKALEEPAKPKDEDINYLYYEFPGDTGELYTIEYNFDSLALQELRMDAYFVSPADAHSLFESFRAYYRDKYGATEEFYGFAAWAFTRPDGRKIQLELTDESAEYRQGKFSLVLYFVPDDPLRSKVQKKP